MAELTKLNNGLSIVCEPVEHCRSVSVGIWVPAGPVDEPGDMGGISHFIEHMVFKGTEHRTARQISVDMDRVGGQLNAFTAKECTCFYTRVMDEHAELAVDVLSDMVRCPKMDPEDIAREKGVVLEEISMVEDTPEDLVNEMLSEAFFRDNPLAKPILGTADSVSALTREDILGYMNKHYCANNLVLAVAGNVSMAAAYDLAEKYLGDWQCRDLEPRTLPVFDHFERQIQVKEKSIEQAHLCLGLPGVSNVDEDFYVTLALSNILGGGMSSRLFQTIREEKGLAYTVYSYPSSYRNAGLFSIYAGTSPKNLEKVTELTVKEIVKLREDGVDEEAVAMSKDQLKGSFILSQESVSARMSALGKNLLLQGRIIPEEEVLERIDAITAKDLRRLMDRLLGGPVSVACITQKGEGQLPYLYDIEL